MRAAVELMSLCCALLMFVRSCGANTVSGTFQTCQLECRQDRSGGENDSHHGRQQHERPPGTVRGKAGPQGARGQRGAPGPKGAEGRSCDAGEIDGLRESVIALQNLSGQLEADKKRLEQDVQVLTDKLKSKL